MISRRARTPLSILALSVTHYFVSLTLWANGFALGERAPGAIPMWLRIAVLGLGSPVLSLPEQWPLNLRPFFGDDSNALLTLAALNALLWGGALFVPPYPPPAIAPRGSARRPPNER